MFIRLIVLIALLAIFGSTFLYLIFNTISSNRRKRNIRLAIQQADDKERRIWNAAENIQDLISLYTRMVFKHGPDSDEAQSFRFGVENKELLSSDNESLEAFNRIADIIRYNVKQNKKLL